VVAVCAERSLELLPGVLKAGAAYLPIDPGYPADRVVMLLVHSNRRDPRTRAMVGAVIPDSLFALDLGGADGGADLAATCRAAERNALLAYRNTQYDPFAMWAVREETGRRRGRQPDLNAFFNDRLAANGRT
jgi:hypothetical protein